MVDVKEKNEASKSNFSPEDDAPQIILTPAIVLSTSIMIMEETEARSGDADNMEEPEKVKDEGNAMIGLKIDEEHKKEKAALTEGEKGEAQAAREDAVRGKDKENTEEHIKGGNLGESLKGKRKRPRKRNKWKKLAQKASQMVVGDGHEVNAMVAANSGLTIEEHNKEKAIGEVTQKEHTVKEAPTEGKDEVKMEGLKIDEGSNKEKALTEGGKDEAQAVREDSVRGKDEENTKEHINGGNLGESIKGKRRRLRKRNKRKKLAQEASQMVAGDGDEVNALVVANTGLTIEGHNKQKAIGEDETHKEDAVNEASIKGGEDEKIEEKKIVERVGQSSIGKGRKPRKRNRKKKDAQQATEMVDGDGDKLESSGKKNASKTVESMGMIFMCSSKTKPDCFLYKILGLPAGKKDQVAKVYKGMKLFLFDVDLRLMYGIFKAAGAGGYNIEPKAFKSAFPSQVRFTVVKDCLPLAEEKFRNAIKENYYTWNKFDCQLNAQQVKKLSKLFLVTRKSNPIPKRSKKNHQSGADASTGRHQKKRNRRAQEDNMEPHPPLGTEQRRYYGQAPVLYEQDNPVPRYLPLPPVRSYGYDRTYSYARDSVLEHQSYHVLDMEPRHYNEIVGRDHYHVYSRDPPTYGDTVYPSIGQTVEYHHRAAEVLPTEYHPSPAPQAAGYHLSGGLQVSSYRDLGLTSEYHLPAASLSYRTRYGY